MKRRRQRAKTRFKPLADMPIRDRKSEAFRCLDARLARVALVSESAREIPPSGRRVAGTRGRGAASAGRRDMLAPAMQRPGQALEGLIAVPATLRDLPLTRLGLLALVSESSVRRLATCDRVSVLVEAEPSRADAVGHLLARPGIERVRAVSPGLFIARVPRGRLEGLAANAAVRFVEASVRLRSHCELAHVRSDLVAADGKRRVAETGKGVLIGQSRPNAHRSQQAGRRCARPMDRIDSVVEGLCGDHPRQLAPAERPICSVGRHQHGGSLRHRCGGPALRAPPDHALGRDQATVGRVDAEGSFLTTVLERSLG
jgi:hypothetical protein